MKPQLLNRFLITQILTAVSITSSAYAADRTWTGAGANNNWTTIANWSGSVVPGATDRALFGSLGSPNARPNAGAAVTPLQIRFNAGGASFSGTNALLLYQWRVGNGSVGAVTTVEVESGNNNAQTINVNAAAASNYITIGNSSGPSTHTILNNGGGLLTIGSSTTGGLWLPSLQAGSDGGILAFNGTGNTLVGGIGTGDFAIKDNGAANLGLTKNGSGTLTLTSLNNSYTGTTTVSDGKLIINGNVTTSVTTVNGTGTLGGTGSTAAVSVTSGGTLAPGDGGIESLNINGALSLAGGSFSTFEINTTGDAADLAIASALLTFGGTLNVNNIGGALQDGDVFNLFDGSITGSFSTVNLPTLGSGLTWNTSNLNTNGSIAVVPEPAAALLGSLGLLALLRRRRN